MTATTERRTLPPRDKVFWIIGGGPSIMEQFHVPEDVADGIKRGETPMSGLSPYLSSLHDRHVIGVNNAYQIGHWIPIIFFGDRGWYSRHREALQQHPGRKVTCCSKIGAELGVEFWPCDKGQRRKRGLSPDKGTLCWNLNSGAAAIDLACHLGAELIVLLGFDMDLDGQGHSHWHGRHWDNDHAASMPESKYTSVKYSNFKRHLQCFGQIAEDARNMGVQILNASPASRITAFPRINVSEVLDAS